MNSTLLCHPLMMRPSLTKHFRTITWGLVLLIQTTLPPAPLIAADFADQLPRIAPTAADQTIDHFQVAAGFKIQLIAAEPLVTSPVAAEWDAEGALYVCEMRGYSENRDDRISRVTRLLDTDHDGIYDQHTVFADQLYWPTALFPYDGGLFVADAPDLLYLKDHDGDGVAESREVYFTGFSTGNVQGLVNSFHWGLDNRIHLACGTVGGRIGRPNQNPAESIEVRGYDLAFDPRTRDMTLTSGGAQHGMCFDDWGRKFVSSNSDHLQQVMYEERYIKRNPFLVAPAARQSIANDGPQAEVFRISSVEAWRIIRTRLRVAGLVRGPIEGGGRAAGYFTGASGVTVFRGDAWPNEDHAIAIVGDVGSNLIHRKRLSGDGVQLQGERIDEASEFVASNDNWFRPAQFVCGPDGTLTVIDVYREVIEHPLSLPPEIKTFLDLTSGRDRGRLYRVVPEGYQHRPTPRLSEYASHDLAQLLNHPNAWHRETAARLIFTRQDPSIATALRLQARSAKTALGRLHSLYALHGLGRLNADDVIERFSDEHPQVVRHAIRIAELFASDPIAANQIVLALEPLLAHESIDVRYQLAFSLGEFPIPDRAAWLAKLIQQDPTDRWIQTAVTSSVGDDTDLLFARLLQFDSLMKLSPYLTQLSVQIDRRDDNAARCRSIDAIVEMPDDPQWMPVIESLGRSDRRQQIGEERFLQLQQMRDRLVPRALAAVEDAGLDDDSRIRAIELLQKTPLQKTFAAFLDTLRQDGLSAELQLSLIHAMGRSEDAELDAFLIERWPSWSPRLRAAAGEVLFASARRAASVLNAIDDERISAADLSLVQWNTLAASSDPAVQASAKKYLAGSQDVSRASVIAQYQPSLQLPGDAARGEEVFKSQCAGCHRVAGLGQELGPSLAAAATRGSESILTNVMDPSREVNPQYINYVVLMNDGRTLSGMITAENANSITLRRAELASDTVLRSDIEWIRNTNQSIMPVGFEKAISPQALSDLIEYLMINVNQQP